MRRIVFLTAFVFLKFGLDMSGDICKPHDSFNSFYIIFWCIVLPIVTFAIIRDVNGLSASIRAEETSDAARKAFPWLIAALIGCAILAVCFGLSVGPAKQQRGWYLVGSVVSGVMLFAMVWSLYLVIRRVPGWRPI
jgi:hypothetical protein